MNSEQQSIERIRTQLVDLGYDPSAIVNEFNSPSGRIDLVVIERTIPKIIIEIKEGSVFPENLGQSNLKFDPLVRATQRQAREIGAPFYAIADNERIHWFDTDESGRPRLLLSPVLPERDHEEFEAQTVPTRELISRALFDVLNMARGTLDVPKMILLTTIAIYARILAESNEPELERALVDPETYSDAVQTFAGVVGLSDSIIMNKPFFLYASESFSQVSFSNAPVEELLRAFDELLLMRTQTQAFKLPRWLSDLFVQLSDIRSNDRVLDLFSNFGDVAAAIARSNESARVVSVVNHPLSYLWSAIQQRIL
jgi:hypothetical protein